MYRDLGYSAKEAQRMRTHALDVSNVRLDPETKQVEKKNNYKQTVKGLKVDLYSKKVKSVENDTVLSRWGMLTKDDRYKGETHDIVSAIKKDMKINNKQAYYFAYVMLQSGMTYKQAKRQMRTDKLFEKYSKKR